MLPLIKLKFVKKTKFIIDSWNHKRHGLQHKPSYIVRLTSIITKKCIFSTKSYLAKEKKLIQTKKNIYIEIIIYYLLICIYSFMQSTDDLPIHIYGTTKMVEFS